MKAGDYTINTFNFRKILNAVLNPYVIIPEMNTTSVKMNDGLDYNFSSMTKEEALEVLAVNAQGMPMMFPLDLQMDGGDWWRLPYEPLITVTGKNTIVKKKVSKGAVRGSIKEKWCQDDYSISIEGLLMGSDGQYPKEDVMKLRRFCEAAKLKVRCPLFEVFSISRIVIETFDFPMTSGPQNQGYKIGALSDDMYKLLLKKEDLKKI